MARINYRNGKQRIRAKARAVAEAAAKNQSKSDFCNYILFPLLLVIATALFFNIEHIVIPMIIIIGITLALIAEN
jgi:hypothetical protein